MGHKAYLNVGDYFFAYVKYVVPLSWTLIFDRIDTVCITSVANAKEKLNESNVKIEDVEFLLGSIFGNDKLAENRKNTLDQIQYEYGELERYFKYQDTEENEIEKEDIREEEHPILHIDSFLNGLGPQLDEYFAGSTNEFLDPKHEQKAIAYSQLRVETIERMKELVQKFIEATKSIEGREDAENTKSIEDKEETNESDDQNEEEDEYYYSTGDLEVPYGIPEISALYQLLLALEFSDDNEKIILDMRNLYDYFQSNQEEDDEGESIIPEYTSLGKESFIDKYSIMQYLYSRFIIDRDEVKENLKYIKKLSENELIEKVLVPLFKKMGYYNVKAVPHGPEEKGIDIGPFFENKFTQLFYYGIQAKVVKIHTNSRKEDGNAELILTQLRTAMSHEFEVDSDNKIKLSDVFLITSKEITNSARGYINKNLPHVVIIMDGNSIAELTIKNNLKFF
ncbi:MAG: restriction endonuclease [Candidatus Nitrosocosmicus sp.]|nr:restriction endonuclease [Candidatus Nitrosocosmicus sp.]MDN5867851.1 restriction endonuclease [Candidatus Nitrosocosmicus sp.]